MCSLALSFPWLLSSPLQIAYVSTVSPPGRLWIPLTNINSKELQEKTKLGAYIPGQQSVGRDTNPYECSKPHCHLLLEKETLIWYI